MHEGVVLWPAVPGGGLGEARGLLRGQDEEEEAPGGGLVRRIKYVMLQLNSRPISSYILIFISQITYLVCSCFFMFQISIVLIFSFRNSKLLGSSTQYDAEFKIRIRREDR